MAQTWKSFCGCKFDVTDKPVVVGLCDKHTSYEEALAENQKQSEAIAQIEETLKLGLGDVQYVLVEKRIKEGVEEIISEKELVGYIPPEKFVEIFDKEDGTKGFDLIGFTEKEKQVLEKLKAKG